MDRNDVQKKGRLIMNRITIQEAHKLASPGPITLICTETPDKKTNLAPVGWWTILSYNPGMIGFAMAKSSYSGEMVRRTKKVIITIPSEELDKVIIPCGTTTGRDTDKVDKFGIALEDVPDSTIKVPANSSVVIKADLEQTVEVGDHYLYICSVQQAYGDENNKPLVWR